MQFSGIAIKLAIKLEKWQSCQQRISLELKNKNNFGNLNKDDGDDNNPSECTHNCDCVTDEYPYIVTITVNISMLQMRCQIIVLMRFPPKLAHLLFVL